jgi:antitoxin FitA
MIRVRDVPEPVHSTLKARAAREGMSLSDFIKRELERAAERPTMREWLERAQQTKPIPAKWRATSARVTRFTMIVLDASVVVELLTNGGLADSLRMRRGWSRRFIHSSASARH